MKILNYLAFIAIGTFCAMQVNTVKSVPRSSAQLPLEISPELFKKKINRLMNNLSLDLKDASRINTFLIEQIFQNRTGLKIQFFSIFIEKMV